MGQATTWIVIGFIGQALFSARFLLQWLASERARRSVIPVVSTCHREDPRRPSTRCPAR